MIINQSFHFLLKTMTYTTNITKEIQLTKDKNKDSQI